MLIDVVTTKQKTKQEETSRQKQETEKYTIM